MLEELVLPVVPSHKILYCGLHKTHPYIFLKNNYLWSECKFYQSIQHDQVEFVISKYLPWQMQESDVTRIQLAKLLSQLQPIVPADIRHVKKELKKKVRVGNSVITKCITMILEYPGWLFHFLLEVMTGKFCEIQFTVSR